MAVQSEKISVTQGPEVTRSSSSSTTVDTVNITVPNGEVWYIDDFFATGLIKNPGGSNSNIKAGFEIRNQFGHHFDRFSILFSGSSSSYHNWGDRKNIGQYVYGGQELYLYLQYSNNQYSNDTTYTKDNEAIVGIRRVI